GSWLAPITTVSRGARAGARLSHSMHRVIQSPPHLYGGSTWAWNLAHWAVAGIRCSAVPYAAQYSCIPGPSPRGAAATTTTRATIHAAPDNATTTARPGCVVCSGVYYPH